MAGSSASRDGAAGIGGMAPEDSGIPVTVAWETDAQGVRNRVLAEERAWAGQAGAWQERLADFVALCKPRILALLVITGFCAMAVASQGLPSPWLTVKTLAGLALSVGGANSVNMWYDRDIDGLMLRTQARPIPSGRLRAEQALWFGVVAGAVSTAWLWWAVGWLAAVLALSGFVYYAGVYTMWLKRNTPQNIVIGGGAGAFPPLVGWAAVTGHIGLPAVIMFLIVFLWTPPHFWALALYKQEDYRRAHIPMLPVVAGERVTKWQMFGYAWLLWGVSLGLGWTHAVGSAYEWVAGLTGLGFVVCCGILLMERMPRVAWAKRTFRFSLLYLTLVFGVMVYSVLGAARPH